MTVATRHGSAVITMPTDTSFVVTRQFDAPATLVFDAYTTPELVRRWYGFVTSEWLVCEIDLRAGGRWRFVTREDDGTEVGFHGEYREIARPTTLVSTEVFEGVPDGDDAPAVNHLTLSDAGGVTTLTLRCELPSQEVRDMIIASGMESGLQVSYDRLEDLVRS
jgi:uncharacterized protein YndB with AHSA1/START domain